MAGTCFVVITIDVGFLKWDFAANNTGKRPLIYNLWLPFDHERHFYVTYFSSLCAFMNAVAVIIASDFVILTLIMYYLCELKVLRYYFEHYDEDFPVFNKMKKGKYGEIYDRVRWCVLQHYKIIE